MLEAFSQENLPPYTGKENYFDVFSLKPSFHVDVNTLEPLFLQLQMKVHPDKFVQADISEQMLSVQWTSFINEAYETLSKPLNRALYLLKLAGAGDVLSTGQLSTEAMTKQFAWREVLMEGDDISSLKKEVQIERSNILETLEKAFLENNLEQAKEKTITLQFVEKFLKEIKNK